MIGSHFKLPNGTIVRNRLAKSAMTEGLADTDQLPNKLHNKLYSDWIRGGAGLLITGNVMIDPEQLERPGNVAFNPQSRKQFAQAWRPIVEEARSHNTVLFMQLSHPGRQCPAYVSKQPWGPSAVKLDFLGNYGTPKSMTEADIQVTIARFAEAAAAAEEAGFSGVQIHAAHGYLVSSFLSPLTNLRTDMWGGNRENRARFLLKIIEAIQTSTSKQFGLSVKLNLRDFKKGGFSLDDCSDLIKTLNSYDLDFLEVSGGSYEQPVLLGRPYSPLEKNDDLKGRSYFESEANVVRAVAEMPTMLTGGIRSTRAIQELIENKTCDLVGLARPFCLDPAIAHKILSNEIERLPEENLKMFPRLAPHKEGRKPSTKAILNVLSSLAWYFCQIKGIATQRSRANYGAWRALFYYLTEEHVKALKLKIRKSFHHRFP